MPLDTSTTVRCERCGSTRDVNYGKCLHEGFPTCCGETMLLLRRPDGASRVGGATKLLAALDGPPPKRSHRK